MKKPKKHIKTGSIEQSLHALRPYTGNNKAIRMPGELVSNCLLMLLLLLMCGVVIYVIFRIANGH